MALVRYKRVKKRNYEAAVNIQKRYKGHRARITYKDKYRVESEAAVTIQRIYRGHKPRKTYSRIMRARREEEQRRENAARVCQRAFRRYKGGEVLRLRKLIKIQEQIRYARSS